MPAFTHLVSLFPSPLLRGEMSNIKVSDKSIGKNVNIPKNINKISCWEKDAERRPFLSGITEYIKKKKTIQTDQQY